MVPAMVSVVMSCLVERGGAGVRAGVVDHLPVGGETQRPRARRAREAVEADGAGDGEGAPGARRSDADVAVIQNAEPWRVCGVRDYECLTRSRSATCYGQSAPWRRRPQPHVAGGVDAQALSSVGFECETVGVVGAEERERAPGVAVLREVAGGRAGGAVGAVSTRGRRACRREWSRWRLHRRAR